MALAFSVTGARSLRFREVAYHRNRARHPIHRLTAQKTMPESFCYSALESGNATVVAVPHRSSVPHYLPHSTDGAQTLNEPSVTVIAAVTVTVTYAVIVTVTVTVSECPTHLSPNCTVRHLRTVISNGVLDRWIVGDAPSPERIVL